MDDNPKKTDDPTTKEQDDDVSGYGLGLGNPLPMPMYDDINNLPGGFKDTVPPSPVPPMPFPSGEGKEDPRTDPPPSGK